MATEATIVQFASASAPPTLDVSPHGNFSDGQAISIAVGPNAYFTTHSRVIILECADPGGLAANLPKDDTACDGNTVQASTILVSGDGGFSDASYTVYLLPSVTLGEQSNFKPICNQTNYCVLYVGQNQNDFTAPKVFSAPFLIAPSSGTTTTTAASAGSGGSAGTTGTTAAPTPAIGNAAGSGVSVATSAGSTSGTLANTGQPAEIGWVVVSGMALLLCGALGRRFVLRGGR
jgi:hypothetical protein